MEHKYFISYTYWDKIFERQIFESTSVLANLSNTKDSISDIILNKIKLPEIHGTTLNKYSITIISISKLD